MKKDVIYIDIEDDITAIIEKLKNANEKIVALVPPKGNPVLQSIVNLKLLKRAAVNAGKQPVLVTSNHALTALAGGLEMYVAKNLQSKPVLAAQAPEVELEDSVEVSDEIDARAGSSAAAPSGELESDEVELSGEEIAALESENKVPHDDKKPLKKPKGGKSKVPNFDSFRKKLLIGGGIALLLLVVGVFVFGRGKADIVVRAETTPVDIAFEATLNANSTSSDLETANLKAVVQEKKQSVSQGFAATGQKDIGEKATGKVRFESTYFPALFEGITIPAGTTITASGGKKFVTNEAARLDASSGSSNKKTVNVTAAESGPSYNGASGSASGGPSSVSVAFVGSTSGGTTQVVKVVTRDDVEKAKEQLNQQDTNAVKEELKQALGKDIVVLEDSLSVVMGQVMSEPAVDQEANEAKLTAEITYTLLGVSSKDLGEVLDFQITSQMTNKDQQRVYENGISNVRLEKISADSKTASYKISTLAYYGPQFDIEKLKAESSGKKFGEVRSYLQDLPGVKGVDISLSPFWARNLPGEERIHIKLDVDKTNRE
jgi:hypothetical protein